MNGNTLTQKQFSAMITTSLLSPLLRSLPRAAVESAGKAAWLSVFPAFFLLFAMMGLQGCLVRQLPPGKGYADLILKWMGPVAGRAVLILFWVWFLFYSGFVLRSGAERLVAAVYPESPQLPFLLVMTVLCLLVSLGSLRAAGRTAYLLRTFLLFALAMVLFFAAPNISRENLLPVPWNNAGGTFLGALPIAAIGGLMGCFPFLMGYVEPIDQPAKKSVSLILIYLAIAGLICLEVVGTFGAELTKQLAYPFFLMVRDISIFHITQRIEAVVVVLWFFADFILCAAMLRCAYECIRLVFSLPNPETEPLLSLKNGRWLMWFGAAFVVFCGSFVTNSALKLEEWSDLIIPCLGTVLIYVVLPILFFIGWARGKTEKVRRHGLF